MKKYLPFNKKYWPALLLVLCCSIHAWSQRYDFAASSGTFTPLVGGAAVDAIEDDDVLSATLPIGFTFNYFGADYTQFKASSNGFITFDVASTFSSNFNEMEFSFETKMIAPLWDDLDGTGGSASYQVSGSGLNEVLTIEWLNWQWDYQASAGISFQLKLYESTHTTSPNKIEFVYRQEAGALNSADASIGLKGNTSGQFYSLTNSSASPVNSPSGIDNISSKPANGQVYAFTPSAVLFVAPTVQATNITTPSLGSITTNLAWTNGNGTYRAVFMKQTTSTVEIVPLTNNTFYSPSTTFGNNQVGASGWYCVYNGTGSSASVTNLQSGLPYRIQVVEYNGVAGTQKYNLTTATNNPVNATTVLVAPVAPISTLAISYRNSTEVAFDLLEGNGTKRAIFMKAGPGGGTAAPVDNTTYPDDTNFGSGSQIGTSGWFCVFNGVSHSGQFAIGLSGNTTYSIHVVDYNGLPGSERYFSGSSINNPVQFTTFPSVPVPTYLFAATAGAFTPITGGTAVDVIEGDDVLSGIIPIGFTFYHGGVPFTEFKASSNGFLTFNTFEKDYTSFNSLDDSYARPLVAPLWDDLDGAGGAASYLVTGSAPNRVFTFEWLNWQWDYTATAGISFQVKLYESTHTSPNKIEYVYRQEAGTLASPTASIGMSFPNFGSGNFLSLNNSTASPTPSTTGETSTIAAKPATGQIYSFIPQKINQTISFDPLTAKTLGDPVFDLTATSSSGLLVSYVSSNTGVATVSGTAVTLIGVGTTTITASQIGNSSFNAALAVDQILTVSKIDQTITFAAIPDKILGDAPFSLTATASSSLPVSFSTISDKISITGSQISLLNAGSVTIASSQIGNASYNSALAVLRTFCINPAKPTISSSALNTETPVLTSSAIAGNQWYKDGVAISGATNVTFTVSQPGVYTVIAKVDNCSSVVSAGEAMVITGDGDKVVSVISVYPNPVENELWISVPSSRSVEISIVDMLGRTAVKTSGSDLIRMDMRNFNAGSYVVLVQSGKELVSKRINKK